MLENNHDSIYSYQYHATCNFEIKIIFFSIFVSKPYTGSVGVMRGVTHNWNP